MPGRLSDSVQLTPSHRTILLLAWAGWVFDFYDLLVYSWLVGDVSRALGLTPDEGRLVMAISLGATAVGGAIFGWLADRYGRKAALSWTILAYSTGAALCGLSFSLESLIVFRCLTGIGVGGEWAVGHALIAETFPRRRRGHFGALMQTGAPVGVGLAAIVGGLVAPAIGWRATFLASGVSAVLVAVIRRKMPESDIWLERRRLDMAAGGSLSVARGRPFFRLFAPDLRRVTASAFALTLFNMSAYWIAFSWMPGFLERRHGVDLNRSVALMLTIVIGELVGYGFFGLISDRIGRKPAFTLFATVFALGLGVVTLAWDAVGSEPLLLHAALAVTGIGTGTWSSFGPFFSELFPTGIRTFGVSTVYNLARGVQFAAPLLADAERPGTIAIGAGFSLLAAGFVWTLPETRGRDITAAEE